MSDANELTGWDDGDEEMKRDFMAKVRVAHARPVRSGQLAIEALTACAVSSSTRLRNIAADAKEDARDNGYFLVTECIRRDADEHAARTLRARRAKSWLWRLWWRLTERRPKLLRVAR